MAKKKKATADKQTLSDALALHGFTHRKSEKPNRRDILKGEKIVLAGVNSQEAWKFITELVENRPSLECAICDAASRYVVRVDALAHHSNLILGTGWLPEDITPKAIRGAAGEERRRQDAFEERWYASRRKKKSSLRPSDAPASKTTKKKRKSDSSEAPQPVNTKKNSRKVFGSYSAVSVVRWCSAEGWTLEEVVFLFAHLGIKIAENTIRCRMKDAGKLAALSLEEQNNLTTILEEMPGN